MTDTGVRPEDATETVEYEAKNVQTVRGTEKLVISKWEKGGWELVTQNAGKLRTELVFRRPKPKIQWKLFAIIGGVLVVLGIFIGIMAAITGGDKDGDTGSASKPSTQAAGSRDEPEEPAANAPAEEPLTVENNADLSALLTGPQDGPAVEAFAQKYAGQLIEFDGSIGAMNKHDGHTTRYDILIANGDYSETHSNGGPSFQFRDVNITNDMHLTGDVPDTIGVGTNVHVIARVSSIDDQLFLLEPVQTSVR